MRGAFFILILIAMLIVAFLVMKNIDSANVETGVDKLEMVDMAKDVAQETENASEKLQKRVGDIQP